MKKNVQFRFTEELVVKKPQPKPKPEVDPRNKLNDLTGGDWLQFTKSWFNEDGKSSDISKAIELHPASFPPPMIERFIKFFTKEGEWVLDPFLGTGSTLVACDATGRKGVGIELYKKYAKTAKSRTNLKIYNESSFNMVPKLIKENKKFKLCITSPPYWNILKKKKDYTQKARALKGLDLKYGDDPNDLGQVNNYEEFLDKLNSLFLMIYDLLEEDVGHLIVIVQNVRHKGETVPFAFDIVHALKEKYQYQGERIWTQNQKTLRPYGYPFAFVPNVHHHYCLIFKKRKPAIDKKQKKEKKVKQEKEEPVEKKEINKIENE